MKPSIGRIVLFTLPEGERAVNGERTFPAIITMVHGERLVNLRVFKDEDRPAVERYTSVDHADEPGKPYTWSWPPRL